MDKQLYLFFDTETTGLPKNYSASSKDLRNWPRLVQISWIVSDSNGSVISKHNHFIKPRGFEIPENVAKLHGITTERALEIGERVEDVLHLFWEEVQNASYIIGHNVGFDEKIVEAEFYRMGEDHSFLSKHSICTKLASTDYCKIPSPGFPQFKWPKLSELYYILFGKNIDDAHNSEADVNATFECFWELKKLGIISGLGVDGGIIPIADEYTSDNRLQLTTFAFNAVDYYGYGSSTDQGLFWVRLVEQDWNLYTEGNESQILVFHTKPYLQAHLMKNGIGIAGRFSTKEYNSIILSFGDESYYLHCVFYNRDIIILRFDQSNNHICLSRKDLVFHSIEEIRSYLINMKDRIDSKREEERKQKLIKLKNREKELIEDICRTDVETSDRREELIKREFNELSSIIGTEEAAKYQKYVDLVINDNKERKEREAEEREKREEKKLMGIAVCAVFIIFICIWSFSLFFHLSNKWDACAELLGWSMLLSILGIICLPYALFQLLQEYFNKVKAITATVLFVLSCCITIFFGYIYYDDWSSFEAYEGEVYLSLTKYNIFENEAKSHIKQKISSSDDLEELNKFLHNNTSGYYEKEAKERQYAIADQLYNQAETLGDWLYLINNAPQEYKTEAEKNYAHLDSIVWGDENLAYKNAKSLRSLEAYNKYLSQNFNNESHRKEIENYVSKQNEFNDMIRRIKKDKTTH